MAIPDFQTLMLPVLEFVASRDLVTPPEIRTHVKQVFSLSQADEEVLVPSGQQPVLNNRVAWTLSHLKQALLVESPQRSVYRITQRGRELLKSKPARIDLRVLSGYPEHEEFRTRRQRTRNSEHENVENTNSATPDEALVAAHEVLQETLARELLQRLEKVDPFRFEQVVVDLLFAMGYGGTRSEAAQVTKRAGDEGIDGIINQDRLGLDVVYVQAKRWQQTVGRPQIQEFVGALAGKQATKGIFITTSSYARSAVEYASSLSQKIILIDGVKLATLMIECNVGVAIRDTLYVKKIDQDYFEE